MKPIAKRKGKRVVVEAEISNETSSARVTQSQVKHLELDSRDQPNIKTLATSSHVELSALQVNDMPVSTSKKSLANSSLTRRDPHNKTRTLPLQVSHSPLTYIDLEDEDTPPPTPPARVGSDSDREIPEDRVVQKKKIQTVSIKHASPTT